MFFFNLDLLKKHIKITDVKIKQKRPSSPFLPENQPVFTNRREGSHSVTFHKIIYFVSLLELKFKTGKSVLHGVLALPVCRTMKGIALYYGIMQKEKRFLVSVNGSF